MKIAISHANAAYMMGGSTTYAWALARFLKERGHQACLVAGQTPEPVRIFPEVDLQLFPFKRRERFPKLGTRFRKLMERCSFGWNSRHFLVDGRFDVLNVHKPYDLPLAAWVKRRSGCKIVWRCHGPDYYAGFGTLLRRADAVYCVSECARQDLLSFYPRARAEVIYTGVDTSFFSPPAEASAASNSRPEVLYFGRLEGWKGVEHLVRAFKALGDLDFRGRIVGEGPDDGRLKALVAELGLEQKVSLEPALRGREAIRGLLAGADVVAFTSVAVETLSNAMLEAMAMARPMIATRLGCFAEVLEHERTALLVEPRDPVQLAKAIRELVENPARRAALGEAARQRAVERFDAQKSFLRVEQLFSDLCVPR